jgi:uncharacterized repeat protein (TIGR04138 family)
MINPSEELLKNIDALCEKDDRYKPESYLFLLAALHFTVSQLSETRHVSGKELLEGIRLYGLDQFGPLTRQVFEHWGVTTTEDFGHIVFNLVSAELLGKTEEDSLEDFVEVYHFDTAFDPQPLFKLADES